MDIHRCRFIPYPAIAINALAFSHPSSSSKQRDDISLRLAIGRANGDIEIWNPLSGIWHQEVIIPGGKDRSIDGLVWTSEADEQGSDGKVVPGKLRLFSIGYTTAVTEWDLEKLRAKRHASGQHGEIWCISSQPPSSTPAGTAGAVAQKLLAGTIDGCLALYSIENDDLQLQRVIVKSPSKKTKMVSITFQSRHVAIVGCSDSSIRAYDVRNGTIIRHMTLGSDLVSGAKEIIAWSVKCLPNGDIVSGDSTGQVCIWDGRTYTLAQRIQSHQQDVLSLATSVDGSVIMSGGMDRRTVVYRAMSGAAGRWTKVSHRRYHKHDVKAMASFEGEGLSVAVSGGPDANPIVIPLQEAGSENQRTLSLLPQRIPLASAPDARLIVSWWDREVYLWTLLHSPADLVEAKGKSPGSARKPKMVGRILLKGEANINSASISRDGHLLVVGTATEVKAFRLGWMDDTVRIRRLKNLPSRWNRGASVVQVSPDSCWVCVVQEGGQPSLVRVESVASDAETTYSFPSTPTKLKRLVRPSRQARTAATLGPYDRTITHAAFSADSRILAVADLSGSIDTWILGTNGEHGKNGTAESHSSGSSSEEWEENNLPETGVCWRANPRARLLPRLPSAPVVLSFSGELPLAENDYTLLTVTASGKVIVLNPLSGSITDWSRRNPTSRLPEEFRLSRDILKGVVWQGSRAWLYGVSSLFMLDLSTDFDDTVTSKAQTQPSLDSQVFGKKRKRGNNSGAGDKTARGALATGRVHPTDGNSDEVRLDSRKMHNGSSTQNGDEHDSIDDQDMLRLRQSQKGEEAEVHDAARQNFWFTYKYRPILGLVPLEPQRSSVSNGGLGQNDGKPRPIEVVLVERPQWEVDLPPRYLGKNEYER